MGGTVQETIDDIMLCDVYIFVYISLVMACVNSVMLQINEYDDDDDNQKSAG